MTPPTAPPKKRPSPSRLLKALPEAEILSPVAKPFTWNGESYAILPMPDRLWMLVSDEMGKVMEFLLTLRENSVIEKFDDALPYVPDIIRILLPSANPIIATCLGIEQDVVENQMRMASKIEALTLIVEAENLPLIASCFKRLAGLFPSPEALFTQAQNLTPKPEANAG